MGADTVYVRARMERGSALAGIRAQPWSRFAFVVSLGPGIQRERYDTLASGPQGAVDDRKTSATAVARARVQYAIVPAVLSARLRGDATYFTIHDTVNTLGATGATHDNDSSAALEAAVRVHLDADVLGFFGFLPSLHAGFDYAAFSGSSSGSALTPELGLGFRRKSL